MAVLYKKTPYDTPVDPESLTEQEHKDSCDINKMILAAHRGQDIRQARPGLWVDGAVDDLTQTLTSIKIQKEAIESELSRMASENEFDEEELKQFPKEIKEKFKLRKKKSSDQKRDEPNDAKKDLNTSSVLNKKSLPSESAEAGLSKNT